MIDPNSKLVVIIDDNGALSNVSNKACDFTRDNISVELVALEDHIYIGHHKPFNTVYAEMFTPNTVSNDLVAEYFNGTVWTTLELADESMGFTRSGFIFWNKVGMRSTAINAVERFYIRVKPSVNQSNTSIRAINLVFADDSAMRSEFPEITNTELLPPGEKSHIMTHVASRNFILHQLRNHYQKANPTGSFYQKINQFDLIDIFEIREAAVFLSLSKIFFNLSDSPDDHWWIKYKEYLDKFEEKMTVARLSIDTDNDGIDNVNENQRAFQPTRWAR